MDSLGSETSYNRLQASARGIKSWGPHTFNLGVDGGSSLGSDMPAYEQFSLGGPLRLSAYQLNEFAGRQYAFGRLMYYHRTNRDQIGTRTIRASAAPSTRFDGLPSPGTVWSTSLFLGADTFVGPLYLGVGVGAGRWSLYLLLGAP